MRLMGQKVIMFSRLLLHCARLFSRISTHCFQRWKKTDFAQPCQHRGKGVVNSANLISMKCNLRTVLICISLITNQPNYFPSICLLSAYPPGWSTGPHPSPAYLLEASLIHLNEHFRANKSNHLPARPGHWGLLSGRVRGHRTPWADSFGDELRKVGWETETAVRRWAAGARSRSRGLTTSAGPGPTRGSACCVLELRFPASSPTTRLVLPGEFGGFGARNGRGKGRFVLCR